MRQAARLLVACDFDGTLAPIVPRPEDARPLSAAVAVLAALAAARGVRVAIVSGRALSDVRALCPIPGCSYVGGHGNETDGPEPDAPAGARLRRDLAAAAAELRLRMPNWPGARLDAKPYSLAVHFRQAPEWAEAIRQTFSALAARGHYRVLLGRQMVELLPRGSRNKGQAVHHLRIRLGCDLAFYFGDDVTDEDVFRYPDDRILGVKVENPEATTPSAAAYRLSDCLLVPRALEAIQAAWARGRREKSLSFSAISP